MSSKSLDSCYNLFRSSFIDRDDILEKINESFMQYNENYPHKKVFIFIGIGGIGKTKLINKISNIYKETFNEAEFFQIITHMEIMGEETPILILRKIREKIKYAPLFDYAFLKYWELSQVGQLDRSYLRLIADSLPVKIATDLLAPLDMAIPFLGTGLSIGTSIISKLLKRGNTHYEKIYKDNNLQEKKILLDELSQNDPVHMLSLFPYLLAKDMENCAGNKKQLYIFDAYDKASKYTSDGIEWLKTLIDSFKTGIFIVTSRENPKWFFDNQEESIEVIRINEIPEEYVTKALLRYQIPESAVKIIISSTRCIPIYLDLALSIFEKKGLEGLIELDKTEKEKFALKLINHLSEDAQWVIKIMSIVQSFDKFIYNEILSINNISNFKYTFADFVSSTAVSYIEKYEAFYKIHDVMANDICHAISIDRKQAIASQYIKIINKTIYQHKLNDNFMLICRCLQLGNSLFSQSSDESTELSDLGDLLVQLSLYLIDNGFCNELHSYFTAMSIPVNSPTYSAFYFTKAMYYRNINIMEGYTLLNSIDLNKILLNKQKKLFICESNYLESILGNYDNAESKFSDFYHTLRESEQSLLYYTKGSLYYADMLMLRGRFIDAIDIMDRLLNIQMNQESFICFELHKAIGHCYRFNWMFDKALEHYHSSKNHYSESLRMEAYRLTTECETYCFTDPERLFSLYGEAVEKNTIIHNYNNIGKIFSALSIAYLHKRQYNKARTALEYSRNEFGKTQYQSGLFFADIAEAFLCYAKNKIVDITIVHSLDTRLSDIGSVYAFLMLPIYSLMGNENKLIQLENEVQWISYNETRKRVNTFISNL